MHKNKLKRFLEGESELNPSDLEKNSIENEFAQSYKNTIRQSKTEIPRFDPFEKIKTEKKRTLSLARRLVPFAASLLLVLSVFLFHRHSNKNQMLTESELLDIQENTSMALLHFSKELNACKAKFEEASSIQQNTNNFKIEKNNPFKNFKIN